MKNLMQFRGQAVDKKMSKEELLEVIVYLAAELNEKRDELLKYSEVISKTKLRDLRPKN